MFYNRELNPDSETTLNSKKASKLWPQHAGACVASLAAFAVGNSFGWSSLASPQFLEGTNGFSITKTECSLMESLLTFGAAISCFPAGFITDRFGRKKTLLGLIPISLLGWGFLTWATSIEMLYVGRFLLGTCAGTACVTAPVYAAEISQKEIRGAVGSYFQMLLASGVLFSYAIGSELEVFWLSFICGTVPIIFGIVFSFFPETPVYYLNKGNAEKARNSLLYFRGVDYNYEQELFELAEYPFKKNHSNKIIWNTFISKQGIKSLLMSIGLMVFQQICGINAFLFNATDIFEDAGSSLDSKHETIIIGVMQVAGTFFVIFLVDDVGRILLLNISAVFMAICTFLLGLYFCLKENNVQMTDFSWIPVFSLSVFVLMFSVGFGAVPWMLMSELMPSAIKGQGTSIACITNWMSAFVVVQFYSDFVSILGRGVTFWIFSAISLLATFFTCKVLPETKGKTFEEIQNELGGETSTNKNSMI